MPTTSPQHDRAARARERRGADLAAREEATLGMLAERLPEHAPRIAFPALWADVKHLRGVLGRDGLYRLLSTLDGARLDDGRIVRIAPHDRTARRFVVVRPRRSWEAQREYLARFRAHGGAHPPRPISYKAAHARVRAVRGPASASICGECGDRAAEWAYTGFGLDEQVGIPYDGFDGYALWSPDPADYDPLCRRCHWELDESGVLWGDAPRKPKASPASTLAELPADAPAWLRAMAPEAAAR
jgi:hypothetical protein